MKRARMGTLLLMGAMTLAGLGSLSLITLLTPLRTSLGDNLLILPAILIMNVAPASRLLTDSAHGPPFLTFPGILLFYWAPALCMALFAWFSRGQAAAGD